MLKQHETQIAAEAIGAAVEAACRAIPPVWPLASIVAVNPFLGQSGDCLRHDRRRGSHGWRASPRPCPARGMPRGSPTARSPRPILPQPLLRAADPRPRDVAALKAAAHSAAPVRAPCRRSPTSRPRCQASTGRASSASASAPGPPAISTRARRSGPRRKGRGAYERLAHRGDHDLTPEILGLPGFAQHVANAPEHAEDAIARASPRLGLTGPALNTYFHPLLMTLGGWAQYARYRLWQAELGGGSDRAPGELLAIRLVWEEALLAAWPGIEDRWAEARAAARQAADAERTIS